MISSALCMVFLGSESGLVIVVSLPMTLYTLPSEEGEQLPSG